jgi:hypothetical protein
MFIPWAPHPIWMFLALVVSGFSSAYFFETVQLSGLLLDE